VSPGAAAVRHARPAGGFGYVALLITVAIVALVSTATVRLAAASHRRLAEQALLETGAAYSAALASYARATPKGQSNLPHSLRDLLRDPRFPGIVRHLRRIPVDPLTGNDQWGLVRDDDSEEGAIIGVYSLARGRPVKVANFDSRFPDFAGKQSYAEWRFLLPAEFDPNAIGLARGLISGGVLRGEGPDGQSAQPIPDQQPDPGALISPRGL
jgi:type II secretory pathway pseudopilin PulG